MSYDEVYKILDTYSITSVDCLITSKTQQRPREVETDNCRPRNFKRCFGTSNPIPLYSCSTSHSCQKMFGFNSFSYTDVDTEVLKLLSLRAIKKIPFIRKNFYSRLFLVPQKEGTHRHGSSKQVCRKQPFPNGKHLLPKECPKKERLFDMNRLEGRISVRPGTGVLTKVPLLPMERRNLCLLKPCVWGKYGSQGIYKASKTSSCLPAKDRYSNNHLSRRLSLSQCKATRNLRPLFPSSKPYPLFVSYM